MYHSAVQSPVEKGRSEIGALQRPSSVIIPERKGEAPGEQPGTSPGYFGMGLIRARG